METTYIDAYGYTVNGVADWWRHLPRSRGRWTVFVYGLDGWTDVARRHAVIDDFGTLVPVE